VYCAPYLPYSRLGQGELPLGRASFFEVKPMNRHHQKRRAAIFHVLNQIELPIEAEPDAEALENIRIEIEVDDDAPLASEDDQ
jgi:hypothetical protein